jgi:hypothetical protein
MKEEDIQLICVQDKISMGWTVYLKKLPGIVVKVNDLNDAPEKISNALHDILKYGFDKNIHKIYKANEK